MPSGTGPSGFSIHLPKGKSNEIHPPLSPLISILVTFSSCQKRTLVGLMIAVVSPVIKGFAPGIILSDFTVDMGASGSDTVLGLKPSVRGPEKMMSSSS